MSPAAPDPAVVVGGFFTLTVPVRNPRPYPVVLVPAPPPVSPPAPLPASGVRYQLRIVGPGGNGMTTAGESRTDDPTGSAHTPGETRQRVYDLAFVPGATRWSTTVYGRPDACVLGAGRYVLAGVYGNLYGARRPDAAAVTLGP